MRTTHLKTSLLLLAGLCSCVKVAAESLTKAESADVQKKLEAFEKGTVQLHEISNGEEDRRKIIAYFQSNTNAVSLKSKLVVSRCFAIESQLPQAISLAEEYVKVYSNDWRGWRILGGASFETKSYPQAVWAYTNAVMLGAEDCYIPLGAAALNAERFDIVTDIVPHLLILKKVSRTQQYDKLTIVALLTGYALKTEQPDVFIKAVEGFEAKDILAREDVAKAVTTGCKEFGGTKEVEALCSKLKEALSKKSE
jgi:hypothetical protein